jgi:pectate lyase
MKKIIALAVSLWLLPSTQATVSLPFTDHFDYSEGRLIDVSGGNWVAGNNGTEISVSNSAALTSPSGFAPASGKGVYWASSGTSRRAVLQYTSVPATDGNTVYASFLLNVISPPSAKLIGYLDNNSSSQGSPQLGIFVSSGSIGIGKKSSTPTASASCSSGATHLIVVRYTFQSGNDRADLWVDPSSDTYGADTAPSSSANTTGGSDPSSLDYFQIYSPGTSGSTLDFDEFRVGTTWADVTSTNGATPPPVEGPTNVVITAINVLVGGLNDGDVELIGKGGPANGNYEVETSSDVSIPYTNWLPVAIHQFDSLGNFACTNGVTPGTLQRFFIVRVGGTNSLPPTPPVILTQPQDRTNSAGTTATFTVGVSGSPPFSYQWFLNSITPLSAGTNATLTLNNVQTGDSGGYSVLVSNSAGSITSSTAQLLVTNVFSAPVILTQPQSHAVTVGNNTSFGVVATGTQPLLYQWYFNTNSPLADATNSTLQLNNAQFSDAGDYSVTVSNSIGTTDSAFATLTVNTNVVLNFNHVGYADYNFNLTGGSGGTTVDVYQLSDMAGWYGTDDNPLPNSNPAVLRIHGTVTLRTNGDTYFGNNKTIIGVGTNAHLIGDIGLYGCSNIIIRNLEITNPQSLSYGEGDAISCKNGPNHIWIDHCTLHDTDDGIVDVTRGGDFVTVSYCKFYYTAPTGHEDVNLIGGSDSDSSTDSGKLHVTFHHNWWGALCRERMISCRFGRAHVFNNYYNIGAADNYCNRTRLYAEMLVEGNWFENVKNPWELLTTSGTTGKVLAQYNNVGYLDTSYNVQWLNGWYSGQSLVPGTDTLTPSSWNPASLTDPDPSNVPPYAYTLDNASDVPGIVTNNCGAGKGPFAP